MPEIKNSSSIEEVLKYIVDSYGAEIYQDKQRLSNLIADLYTGEERLKRLYRRMIMEDTVSQQLYSISLKPIQERENFYNQLLFQFQEANFLEESFARQSLEVFVRGLHLLLKEPVSTNATEEDGEWFDEYGVKYSADRKKLIRFNPDFEIESYDVKEGTVVICDCAFDSCSNLRRVILPLSVIYIGNYAFWGCDSLLNIKISLNVTTIGKSAFDSCSRLPCIVIPSSVTSIGDFAFCSCSRLASVEIHSSLTRINDGIFMFCDDLYSIMIPSSVTSIGDSAFAYCSLSNIIIPSGVTSIGISAFSKCDNLYRIVIPSSVVTIGDDAFWGCSNLMIVVISSKVISIGNDVFLFCNKLQQINIPIGTFEIFKELLPGYSHLLNETDI